jgi:hypothetical protein
MIRQEVDVEQVRALLFDVFGTVDRRGVIRRTGWPPSMGTSTRPRSRTAGGRRTARP